MGRELKRVPLDFEWPLETVWKGFLNPHYVKCEPCDGFGATIASQRLSDLVSLLMLSGSDAAEEKCHPYFHEAPLYRTQGKVCGKDMADLTAALAGRSARPFTGHDAVDQWEATRKIIAAAGLPASWGQCTHCAGEGIPIANFAAYDKWERVQPPDGPGFQIWETVSEGSPISPVFATAEELARYMAGKKWGADHGSSYESWLKFINGPGWAPSMVIDDSGIHAGPNAI